MIGAWRTHLWGNLAPLQGLGKSGFLLTCTRGFRPWLWTGAPPGREAGTPPPIRFSRDLAEASHEFHQDSMSSSTGPSPNKGTWADLNL